MKKCQENIEIEGFAIQQAKKRKWALAGLIIGFVLIMLMVMSSNMTAYAREFSYFLY
jgi:hypothetical protein